MSRKGTFKPRNPKKYVGDPNNIIYRSSWELRFMQYLDKHPDVINWASEELAIPYYSPVDKKVHRYFPDFIIKRKSATSSKEETLVIEIKPKIQTAAPKNRSSKSYIKEVMTYGINTAKWKAAKEFCDDRKWTFMVLTEKELGIPNAG
jgi:hypothetical protein